MKRQWYLIGFLLIVGLIVSACGGGGDGGPPVDMEKEEASAFTMERPKDWNVDSLDMFGITILIASSKEIKADTILEGAADPTEMFKDAAGVLIMAVPQEMAGAGDFGFSADEIKSMATEDPDVEIIRQGDVTIDGVKGYELVGKGEIEELGSGKMGAHMAVLERESGPMVFIGFSPEEDVDKNLDIFKYMFESIKFK